MSNHQLCDDEMNAETKLMNHQFNEHEEETADIVVNLNTENHTEQANVLIPTPHFIEQQPLTSITVNNSMTNTNFTNLHQQSYINDEHSMNMNDTLYSNNNGDQNTNRHHEGTYSNDNNQTSTHNHGDYLTVERIRDIPPGRLSDPFQLRTKLVPETSIHRNKRVAVFYQAQNEHINRLLRGREADPESAAQLKKETWMVKFAVYSSLYANIFLSGLQLYAAISSLSLSLFATMVDSVFDPVANLLLNWAYKSSGEDDRAKWPVGKARLETIGSIIYSFIMGAVSLILIVESIRTLAEHSEEDKPKLNIPSIIAVAIAFGVKFILFLICFPLRNKYSQVKALWQDHRNDLFVNAFGITTSVLGNVISWWIDPTGAIIISLIILISWSMSGFEDLRSLVGRSAPADYLQLIAYKTLFFHDKLKQIDTVRAYQLGPASDLDAMELEDFEAYDLIQQQQSTSTSIQHPLISTSSFKNLSKSPLEVSSNTASHLSFVGGNGTGFASASSAMMNVSGNDHLLDSHVDGSLVKDHVPENSIFSASQFLFE